MEKALKNAAVGERLFIKNLACAPSIRARLQDIGLLEGTMVECVGIAPLGDPAAFLIRGAVIALRGKDTKDIIAEEAD